MSCWRHLPPCAALPPLARQPLLCARQARFPPESLMMPLDTQLLRDFCRNGRLTLKVRSRCMSPFLLDGEKVVVTPRRFYWPGDILVFFYGDGGLRIHRLIAYRLKRRSLQLITRGDRTRSFDQPIHLDHVIGKVTAVSSRGHRDRLLWILILVRGMMELSHMAARVFVHRVRRICSAKST
jgi:hypothetical protein